MPKLEAGLLMAEQASLSCMLTKLTSPGTKREMKRPDKSLMGMLTNRTSAKLLKELRNSFDQYSYKVQLDELMKIKS